MDELVKLVAQKTGISEQQARTAVQTVVDFIKSKLPAAMGSQIDAILSGSAASDLGKQLGGLFGGKQ
jgi:uncharacterized protein (DUF2267 family)